MNIKLVGIAAIVTLLSTGAVFAQGVPGQHFLDNWDDNGDGIVTLAEVEEKRGNVFYSFDQEDDGFLSAEDYVFFDEARAADMAMEVGQNGQGRGNGGGHGKGGGHGNGGGNMGQHRGAQGMSLEANDINGDGQVSLAEFMENSVIWLANMDNNSDGVVTTEDFTG